MLKFPTAAGLLSATLVLPGCVPDTKPEPEGCADGFEEHDDGYCYPVADTADSASGTAEDTGDAKDSDHELDSATDHDSARDTGSNGDTDADGWTSEEGDCNDTEAAVNPGATEVCGNGVDDDCDGSAGSCGWSGSYLAADSGLILRGESSYDATGTRVAVGDLDGDGANDALVSAYSADARGSESGVVYVSSGPFVADRSLSASVAILRGDGAPKYFGWAMAVPGDTDGDGIDDVAVGAMSTNDSGGAWLYYGPLAGDVDTPDAEWTGEDGTDAAGYDVAAAGDLDGDGLVDVAVGAPYARGHEGMAYVIRGGESGDSLDRAGARLSGDGAPLFGLCVSGVGDVDGDGIDDLAVGAEGRPSSGSSVERNGAVYIFAGPVSGAVASTEATAVIHGDTTTASSIGTVAGGIHAGDATGDGLGDVLIFAGSLASGGGWVQGALLFAAPFPAELSTSAFDAAFAGESENDGTGYGAALADLDGDARGDAVIGAYGIDEEGESAGAAYVVMAPLAGTYDRSDADAEFHGSAGWLFGYSFAGPHDLTGDGVVDLLVGAPGLDGDDSVSGGAVILEGGGL